MNDLRQAAQALIDRWDSPLWKNGSTADAIADLRAALEQQAEPVAWLYASIAGPVALHRVKPIGFAEVLFVQAQLDNDIKAMKEWPNAHSCIPLYTTPPQQQAEPVGEVTAAVDGAFKCEFSKHLPVGTKLYTAQPQRKPLTGEQDRALCEAYCNDASDEYFKARPAMDFPEMRRIFYAGHRKAWINYEAAHGIKGGT